MDRTDIAYLINTTPKYFYLLPLHLTLLRRYAPSLQWPVYLATEEPSHPLLSVLASYNVTIIPLTQEQEPFLESRAAATRLLPESIQYVFPIQEDFILERQPLQDAIREAAQLLDETSVSSIRLMPSPGPKGPCFGETKWRVLGDADDYIFSYQATLWRREAYQEFMDDLIDYVNSLNPTKQERYRLQIQTNVAETEVGRRILKGLHLAWPRAGTQKNAVYLSPWPYRPTAVVQGRLETWAIGLAEREGVSLEF